MSLSHAELWLNMLEQVVEKGEITAPRGMITRELMFYQGSVRDPMTFPLVAIGRDFKDVIGILEGLSLVGEFSVPELFTDKVKKFADFMDGGIMWGSYGSRTHGQIGDVISLLEKDPDSRQAIMTFYDAKRDLNREKKDIPCTVSAQFLLREGILHLGISMRSNDLWLGTPYDLMQFSILQATVAQALGVRVGEYHHRVGSLHLYDRDIEKAQNVAWDSSLAMTFPLWGEDDIAAIQSRARLLALGKLEPKTDFESWAKSVLEE